MAARVGNRILSIMAGILILLMLSYGVYSLWDTYKIYANSFADEELLKFRPTDDGEDNPTLKDLKKLNPDVKAWIQVPKTNIDYPDNIFLFFSEYHKHSIIFDSYPAIIAYCIANQNQTNKQQYIHVRLNCNSQL